MISQKTYPKAQKCSKFHGRDLPHDYMLELIIHAKAKTQVFPNKFCCYFISRGFFQSCQKLNYP